MPLSNVIITRVVSNSISVVSNIGNANTSNNIGSANVIIGYEGFANSNSSLSIVIDYTDILLRLVNTTEQLTTHMASIKNDMTSIKIDLDNISAAIENINQRGSNENQGFYVQNTTEGNLTPSQQRAVVVSALKSSGSLSAVEAEIKNPTQLPT